MSKGITIHPGPVEACLDDYPEVTEAAVVGIEDNEFGEKVTAVVHASDSSVTGKLDRASTKEND